jgi:hypothetical protein
VYVPHSRVLCTSAAAAAAVVLSACGGNSSGNESETKLVRGPGFSFRAPATWDVTRGRKKVTIVPEEGAPESASVNRYPLLHPVESRPWSQVVGELDGIAGQLGSVDSRRTVKIAGIRGRRYDMSIQTDDDALRQRIVFLLERRTEYQLLCRWQASDSEPDACGLLERTFKPF